MPDELLDQSLQVAADRTTSQAPHLTDVAPIHRGAFAPLIAAIYLGIAAIAFGFLFQREFKGAVDVWLSSTAYNHCFLIIPISLYMMWDRRKRLLGLVPHSDYRFLPLIFVLSLVWVVAAGLGVLEARQFAVIGMFQAVALCILGFRLYRSLLAPFLYLFLLVPSGEFLVPWLQDFTARFVVFGLNIAGVPVYGDGTIIEIPAGTFIVAEACAGLRFLVASLAFGIFFGTLVYRSVFRRVAFVVLSVVVPIIANWVRAFGIVYLANLTGSAQAVMADHIIYGWGFFTAVTILLIFVGYTFADNGGQDARSALPLSASSGAKTVTRVRRAESETKGVRMALTAALAMGLVVVGPLYFASMEKSGNEPLFYRSVAPPAVTAPWHAISNAPHIWRPVVIGADKEFLETYADLRGDRVIFYMAIYGGNGPNNNLVRAQNRLADEKQWHLTKQSSAGITIKDQAMSVGVTTFDNTGQNLAVWHFYIAGSRILPNAFAAKVYQARDFVLGKESASAFIGIAAEGTDNDVRSRDIIESFLNAMVPLPDYLRTIQK